MVSARTDTSTPTTSVNRASLSSACTNWPCPQPRSSTRPAPGGAQRREDRRRAAARRAAPASPRSSVVSSSTALSISSTSMSSASASRTSSSRSIACRVSDQRRDEIAAGDQLLLGVVGQPALARPQQLVDLVGRDPVVLGVVEHRQQHIQVPQRVGEPQLALQHEAYVARVAPLGELLVQRRPARPSPSSPAARTACATSSAPPRAGSAGTSIRNGSGPPARSGRAAHTPRSALVNTVLSATASSEDAAYGRSLTYCASAASGAPPRPLPLPRRTSATGSTSSSSAAVQRSRGRLGVEDVRACRARWRTPAPCRDACAAETRGRSRGGQGCRWC